MFGTMTARTVESALAVAGGKVRVEHARAISATAATCPVPRGESHFGRGRRGCRRCDHPRADRSETGLYGRKLGRRWRATSGRRFSRYRRACPRDDGIDARPPNWGIRRRMDRRSDSATTERWNDRRGIRRSGRNRSSGSAGTYRARDHGRPRRLRCLGLRPWSVQASGDTEGSSAHDARSHRDRDLRRPTCGA
jgi:hypothetical protein